LLITACIFTSQLSHAEETDSKEMPWAKGGIGLGYFITALDTSLRFGTGVGIDIDAESLLGMSDTSSVFRLGGFWRFSKNQRHRLDFNWFSLNRTGSKTIGRDIIIEGPDEEEILIPASSTVDSLLNIDLYHVTYSYSLFLDDRLDIAINTGLYVAPIEMELKAEGLIEAEEKEAITAPLPTLGLRTNISITPKWYLLTNTEVLYLQYNNYKGYILSMNGSIEYRAWKHFGFGTGVDILHLFIESDGEDYPGVDLKGEIEFQYIGLIIFSKIYF
jgi:hypothetical protein